MTPPSIPFALKQPFTLISISDAMAHTCSEEIVVATLLAEPVFRPAYVNATRGKWRFGTFKLKGKRKEFYLDISPTGALVFAGHGVVKVDSDLPRPRSGSGLCVTRSFAGNACINLGGTVADIRELVESRNLNPAFTNHEAVMAIPPNDDGTYGGSSSGTDEGIPVFPEIPSRHAVVCRIREKQATAAPALETPPERSPAPRVLADAFADF